MKDDYIKNKRLFNIDQFENNENKVDKDLQNLKDSRKQNTKTDLEIEIINALESNDNLSMKHVKIEAEQANIQSEKDKLTANQEDKKQNQNNLKKKIQNVPPNTYPPNYARKRKETEFDLLMEAYELKIKTTRYAMNEKRIPKRYRWIEGEPLIKYAGYIRDCIGIANDIKLDGNENNLQRRLKISTYALAFCNVFQRQLKEVSEICQGATAESLKEITELLLKIIRTIPRWQSSDRKRYKELIKYSNM